MPSVAHPPMASMMPSGHSTRRSLSRRLCRKEWMTHPSGTRGFSHLFSAALAELALHLASLQYLGKARVEPVSKILCAAQSDAPTSGTSRLLDAVFSLRQGSLYRSIGSSRPHLVGNDEKVCRDGRSRVRSAKSGYVHYWGSSSCKRSRNHASDSNPEYASG